MTKIENKIDSFIKRQEFYSLIKLYIILFCSFFISTLVIIMFENWLWLSPSLKKIILNSLYLIYLVIFSCVLCIKLYKIYLPKTYKQRIEASKKIWKLSDDINDKLLNILQLKNSDYRDIDLLNIAVEKKSYEIRKINFELLSKPKEALKYLRYLSIPILISLILVIIFGISDFFGSIDRIINKNTEFVKPAPFEFEVTYREHMIENENCEVTTSLKGRAIPENVSIIYDNKNIYMLKNGISNFSHIIKNVKNDFSFHLEANGFKSKTFYVKKINTPKINDVQLFVSPPKYLQKKDEKIDNKGIIYVYEHSSLKWSFSTENTDQIDISIENEPYKTLEVKNNEQSIFISKIKENTEYSFSTSNNNFKNYQRADFKLFVMRDSYPKIHVKKDSLNLDFDITLEDDILLKSIKTYFYDYNYPENKHTVNIQDNIDSQYLKFKYVLDQSLLDSLNIRNLTLYFEVEDNDQINGFKKTTSQIFNSINYSQEELDQKNSAQQEQLIETVEKSISLTEKEKSLEKIEKKISENNNLNWTEKQEINKQIEKLTDNYDNFKKLSESFNKSIEKEINDNDKSTSEQYKNLKENIELTEKRIRDELLKNIEDLKNDISKDENSLDKLHKIKHQNYRTQADLKRMIKLLKKFKFENDLNKITDQLGNISDELQKLSQDDNLDLQKQTSVLKKTEDLKKLITKTNQTAVQENYKPDMDDILNELQDAIKDLDDAKQNLNNNQKQNAKKKNKDASIKLDFLKKKLQTKTQKQKSDQLQTDINTLKLVLNNLIIFSFRQENNIVLDKINFTNIHVSGLEQNIIEQNKLNTIFTPIKDSIYKIGSENLFIKDNIFKNISTIDQEFYEFTSNVSNDKYDVLPKNQTKIMSSTNELAVMLSDILQNLNENLNLGDGSGENDMENIDDIIKKHQKIAEEIKKLKESGQERSTQSNTDKKYTDEENGYLDEKTLEIYKKHELLRDEIYRLTQDEIINKLMENTSEDILENKSSEKSIQNINQRLLKIKNSIYQKETDEKRIANENKQNFQGSERTYDHRDLQRKENIEFLKYKLIKYNPLFQQRIDNYFKNDSI